MKNTTRLFDWNWLVYPAVVAAVIVGCTMFLVKGGILDVYQIWSKKTTAEEVLAREQLLENKYNLLADMDYETYTSDLTELRKVVPDVRSVWNLINELQLAGSRNNTVLVSYQGAVGDIREATGPALQVAGETGILLTAKYDQSDIRILNNILADLEKMLPFISVKKLTLNTSGMEMMVEGAWAPLNETRPETESALPEFKEKWEVLKQQIGEYTNVASFSGN